MQKLSKGESYGLASQRMASQSSLNEEKRSAEGKDQLSDVQIEKYSKLLSVIAKEFRQTDFVDYCPTKVIDDFWSKYHLDNSGQMNLFDLIILSTGAVSKRTHETTTLDSFLKDFMSYMIASHTVHYMNRRYRGIGEFLSVEQVKDIKEGVKINFVSRLTGVA